MPRKPKKPVQMQGPDVVTQTPPEIAKEQALVARIEQSGSSRRDRLNQLVARAVVKGAVRKAMTVSEILDYKEIHDDRLYKEPFTVFDEDTRGSKSLTCQRWEDFCAAVGVSQQHLDEAWKSLDAIGAEAFMGMLQAGLGYRGMRVVRKWSEDDRAALVSAAESGNKDAIVEVYEATILKHAAEKQQLEQERDEAKATAEARDRLVKEKSAQLDELATRFLHREHLGEEWPAMVHDLRDQLNEHVKDIEKPLKKLRLQLKYLEELHCSDAPPPDEVLIQMARALWASLWYLQAPIADLIKATNEAFAEWIGQAWTGRAYPKIDDYFRQEITESYNAEVKAPVDGLSARSH